MVHSASVLAAEIWSTAADGPPIWQHTQQHTAALGQADCQSSGSPQVLCHAQISTQPTWIYQRNDGETLNCKKYSL